MIVIENEFTLRASVERVWAVLIDFGGYAAWHPSVRLNGTPELGKTFDFGLINARTGWETGAADAVITRLEPAAGLEWQVGIRFLFNFAESYTLCAVPGGTRLVHRVAYRGLAVALTPRRVVAKWHTRVRNADVALQGYLETPCAPVRIAKPAVRRAKPRRRPQ